MQEQDPPLLCTVDLPGYSSSNPWASTDATDARLGELVWVGLRRGRPVVPLLSEAPHFPAIAEQLASCPRIIRRCTLSPRAVPTTAPRTALGAWLLRREHERLAGLLAQMPTSEQEDLEMLSNIPSHIQLTAGGEGEDWWRQLLVQFRLRRKRALRRALERLAGACGGSGAAAAQQPGLNASSALEQQAWSNGSVAAVVPACAPAAGGGGLAHLAAEAAEAVWYLARTQLQGYMHVILLSSFGVLLLTVPGKRC